MRAELQTCNMQFLFFSAIVALGILTLIIGRKILQKIPGLVSAVRMHISQEKPVTVDLLKEVSELRKAHLQMSQDWEEIKDLMTTIRDQQSSFAHQLDSDLAAMGERIQDSVRVSLEEECLRNDQRFGRMHAMLDRFREDFFKALKETLHKQSVARSAAAEASTQTERELAVKRRQREGTEKEDNAGEYMSKKSIIMVIQKALTEFLKEARRQMSLQREEAITNLRSIFTQLVEDRDDLKCTIESAFTTATHQTQTSFMQFSNVGREALKCVAVLNESTERTLTTKFQESNEKLNAVYEQLRNLNFDLSSIKTALDSIDGQFDEIYKKLELGCQKNADHSEDVAKGLQKTAQEWNERSSQLDETCKHLACLAHGIRDMLVSLDNTLCNRPADSSLKNSQSLLNQNLTTLGMEDGGLDGLFITMQVCQDRLNSMKDQIDRDTNGIKKSTDQLLDELSFLSNLVQNSVESWKHLSIKMPDSKDHLPRSQKLKEEQTRFAGDAIISDTNSEITLDSEWDKESRQTELENSSEMPGLLGIIDANLDMALHSSCIGDITKNSKF